MNEGLQITRRRGERVMIGTDIIVQVAALHEGEVWLKVQSHYGVHDGIVPFGTGHQVSDEVHIHLMTIKGAQARLRIEAPKSVGIYREEVYMRMFGRSIDEAFYEGMA